MKYVNWVKKAETPDQENYVILPYDESKKNRLSVINFIYGILFILLMILPGFFNHPSSRVAWIFYPYILMLIPAVYFIEGAFLFFKFSVNISKKQWDASLARCKHSAIGLIVLAVLNLILDVIFIIIHRKGLNVFEFVYLDFLIGLLLISVLYGRFFDKNFAKNSV